MIAVIPNLNSLFKKDAAEKLGSEENNLAVCLFVDCVCLNLSGDLTRKVLINFVVQAPLKSKHVTWELTTRAFKGMYRTVSPN